MGYVQYDDIDLKYPNVYNMTCRKKSNSSLFVKKKKHVEKVKFFNTFRSEGLAISSYLYLYGYITNVEMLF